ncbi:hypothetical protein LCGC14_2014830 [marine sediment metagenome]|uniref:Uncharacterized protein n=1 Tax=marine sediment metagenome TaxID=412755 RepID=A0A0F9EZ95_9ZZZZ
MGRQKGDPVLCGVGYASVGDGAPRIAMKKLTGTTGSTEGDSTSISHGLTQSKIIAFQVLVDSDAGNSIPPAFTVTAEYLYSAYLNSTNVVIMLATSSSGNLLTKAITVLIICEE